MRLGIGSYTYGWAVGVRGYPSPPKPMTALELLDKADALGVRVVQIADNLPLHLLSPRDLETLAKEASARSITLEIGTRGIAPPQLRRYLEIARLLKARIIRTVIDTADHQPAVAEIIETLTSLAPEFEQQNATLALENHDRFKATTLLEIFERIGRPGVGLCFDTANSLGCMEGADQVLATLGPHVVNVHVKDVHVSRLPHKFGFLIEGRPSGEGDLDIPQLITRIREHGRDPNIILEHWPAPEATSEAVIAKENEWTVRSIRYLRQFIPD